MGDVTQWLVSARGGDRAALGQVFDLLYPELRTLARSRLLAGERSLTPTMLVHEAYARLVGNQRLALNDRRHFFACAARAMRAVAIDHARRRQADKRRGAQSDASLEDLSFEYPDAMRDDELLALDESLSLLDAFNARQREVVELRYFAGLEFARIAELLQCSERTAKREWERARAFLYAHMSDDGA